MQWAASWAKDMSGMITGVSREWQQVVLSYVLMILIVLTLGYGLGGFLGKTVLTASTRMAGLLLGVVNGAALAGWLLRYVYVSLDGAQATSPLYMNEIARSFMIWAGWYPVLLAAAGAVAAIFSPLRRAQTVVAQASSTTDWQPTYVAPPPLPASAPLPPLPAQPSQPADSTVYPSYNAPTAPYSYSYAPSPAPSASPPPPAPERDAPSTRLFPTSEIAANEVADTAAPPASVTRSFAPPSPSEAPAEVVQEVKPVSLFERDEYAHSTTPSWLMGDAGANSHQPEAAGAPVQDNALRDEAPSGGSAPLGMGEKTCANCGADLVSGAQFCTQCGTRTTGA